MQRGSKAPSHGSSRGSKGNQVATVATTAAALGNGSGERINIADGGNSSAGGADIVRKGCHNLARGGRTSTGSKHDGGDSGVGGREHDGGSRPARRH